LPDMRVGRAGRRRGESSPGESPKKRAPRHRPREIRRAVRAVAPGG